MRVAPRAGAWIEIPGQGRQVCGAAVAPRAGAWIEMLGWKTNAARSHVAPRAGAWIEIRYSGLIRFKSSMSLPVRERGLK